MKLGKGQAVVIGITLALCVVLVLFELLSRNNEGHVSAGHTASITPVASDGVPSISGGTGLSPPGDTPTSSSVTTAPDSTPVNTFEGAIPATSANAPQVVSPDGTPLSGETAQQYIDAQELPAATVTGALDDGVGINAAVEGFAEAYYTINDADTVQTWLQRIGKFATPEMTDLLQNDARNLGVGTLEPGFSRKGTALPMGEGTDNVGEQGAEATVYVEVTRLNQGQPMLGESGTPLSPDQFPLRLTLTKRGEKWLIASISPA